MSLAQVLLGAAANTKVPQRFAPFYNQAINEALVRYGPQWDLLNQARAESAGSLRQRVQQARIAGAMIEDAANRGASTLANAPAPSVNYAGPAGSSAQITGQALGAAREGTLGMLTGAAKDAPVFASQQVAQAQTQHEQDLAKIAGQRQSVAGQVGDYFTGRVNDLITGDRKMRHDANQARAKLDQQLAIANQRNATTVAGQQLAHQDRQAAISQRRQAAANKTPKTKSPYLPATQQASRISDITTAANRIKPLLAGQSPSQAMNTLVSGRPAMTIKKDAKGNPLPNPVQIPAIKAVPPAVARAAYELATGSGLTQGTVDRLHAIGIHVPGQWRPKPGKNQSANLPAAAPGLPGQGPRPT